jgi:putative ATPase
MKDVEEKRTGEVPMHLRNAPQKAWRIWLRIGYKYAHDYEGHIVDQQYLPDEMAGTVYYEPTGLGYEQKIKEWLEKRRKH